MIGNDGKKELLDAEREVSQARVAFTRSSRTASTVGARSLARAWRRARPLAVGAVLVGGLLGTAALIAALSLRRRKRVLFVVRVESPFAVATRRRLWLSTAIGLTRLLGTAALRRVVEARRAARPHAVSERSLPAAFQAE